VEVRLASLALWYIILLFGEVAQFGFAIVDCWFHIKEEEQQSIASDSVSYVP
jgi:hypothetical protein